MAWSNKVRVVIDSRLGARNPVLLGATARLPGGDMAEATITDLSPNGFRATIPGLMVGEEFRIELPVGAAPRARVVWTNGDEAGCVFLAPIALDEVKLIADIWDGTAGPTAV